MDSNTLATTLSAIAAGVSALVAICAIWQSIQQRRLSYKPQIYLYDINDRFYAPTEIRFDGSTTGRPAEDHLDVPIINIGNGAAQNIIYKWDYDFKKSLTEMSKLFKSSTIQIDNKKNNNLSFEIKNQGSDVHILINDDNKQTTLKHNIKFIIPQHQLEKESKKENIKLPTLISCVLYNLVNIKKLSGENIKNIQGPTLTLSYQDSGGATITDQFQSQFIFVREEKSRQQTTHYVSIKFEKMDSRWTRQLLQRSRKVFAKKRK